MKKHQKVKHTATCVGGKCRGRCRAKRRAEEQATKREGWHEENVVFSAGAPTGKSAWTIQMAAKLSDMAQQGLAMSRANPATIEHATFNQGYKSDDLWAAYQKEKARRVEDLVEKHKVEQALADRIHASHRDEWETLGRLLGMAYASGDEGFFALLEGFHRGRLNESQGRRSMGGPK